MPDEFRGIRPKNYSGQNYIAVNHPHKLVAFSRYSVGTPLPAGGLAGGGTYVQAAGANQTEETVQTSASTIYRWAFVANLPRIGYSPAGRIGLWRDPPRTNLIIRSRDLTSGWSAGNGTTTYGAGAWAAPDGATSVSRFVGTSGQYGTYRQPTIVNATEYAFSHWGRATTGTTSHQSQVNVGGNFVFPRGTRDTTWSRTVATRVSAGTTSAIMPADGQNEAAGGGAGPYVIDELIDFVQLEAGGFSSSVIPTAATTAARAGSLAALPLSSLVRAGRLRYRQSLDPLGASDKYVTDGAAVRLWTIDTNTYAEMATATRVLTVVVNGVARVAGVAVGWSAASCVEWSWEVGAGALRVRYRLSTDAGVTWTLPFDPFGGTIHTDAAISTVATSLHTLSDGVSAKYLGAVEIEHERIDVIPSWVLQALPSDVASVKAFFRADGGVTLNSTTVSSWGGQTAAAVTAFSQGTAANQPTYVAAGFAAGRPTIRFDGSNDSMSGSVMSALITASTGYVYALFNPTSITRTSGTAYSNDAVWVDNLAYLGVFCKHGSPKTISAINIPSGMHETAAQTITEGANFISRWRHEVGVLSHALNGSVASVASGNTANLAGSLRLGSSYSGGLPWAYQIAAFVAGNAALSAADDAAIMSFLNAYGGLS